MSKADLREPQTGAGSQKAPNALPALPKLGHASEPEFRAQSLAPLASVAVALSAVIGVAFFSAGHGRAPASVPESRTPPATIPATPAEYPVKMLTLLPEPEGINGIDREKPIVAQAPPARTTASAPDPIPVVQPEPQRLADTAACALGSHPIGDCDCVSDDYSKTSLRTHPTQACLDQEAKRLGHQVVLQHGSGLFELAGYVPEPVVAAPKAIASKRESVADRDLPARAEARNQENPSATTTANANPAPNASSANLSQIAGSGFTNRRACPDPDLRRRAYAEFALTIKTLTFQSLKGQCPPGSKPKPCACEIYPTFTNGNPVRYTPTHYVPAAGVPASCSDPGMQAAIRSAKTFGEVYQAADVYILTPEKLLAKRKLDGILTNASAACDADLAKNP